MSENYFEISDLPVEVQQRYHKIVWERFHEMQESFIKCVDALESLWNSREGEFVFRQEVVKPGLPIVVSGVLWKDLRVKLPTGMRYSIDETVNNFKQLAIALANVELNLGEPVQTETNKGEQQ
jgi:hypothetical protein